MDPARDDDAIYTPDWRRRVISYLSDGRQGSRSYWSFDPERAWTKHRRGVRQELRLARLLDRYMPLRGKDALVLGSHLGNEAIAHALSGARVCGVELDTEALVLSRDLARAHGARLGLARADAGRLPFPDYAFDLVTMSQVLEHQPRDRQPGLLREAWRVLRPGGILWIDTPNQLSFKDRHDTGLPFIHWLPRRLKVPLARALGRSVPTREPAFGYIDVGLHWYISSFRLRKLLVELGPHEVLSRYRGYAGADHYEEARQEEGRSGLLFRAKVAALRASLFVYDWNVFHDLRLVIRKGVPAREGLGAS